MNRAIKTTITTIGILALLTLTASPALAFLITDIDNHWAKSEIREVVNQGIIYPYVDGTFRPEQMVTRAEFAKMAVKAFNISPSALVTFADTANHPLKNYIGGLAKIEAIDPDKESFRPDEPVTREEAISILAKVLRMENLGVGTDSSPYADLQDAGLRAQATAARKLGILPPTMNEELTPDEKLTRAEAAYMMQAAARITVLRGTVTEVDEVYRVVKIEGEDTHNAITISPQALIMRNESTANLDDLRIGDEVHVVTDSTGNPLFVNAKGKITKGDLLSKASEFTRNLLTPQQLGMLVSQDWSGLLDSVEERFYSEVTNFGITPWEARAVLDRDWNALQVLAKDRVIDTVANQWSLSSDFVGAVIDQDWNQLKLELVELQIPQMLAEELSV